MAFTTGEADSSSLPLGVGFALLLKKDLARLSRSRPMLNLKLERPYKDDAGVRLPILEDIAPDGSRVYETPVDPQQSLADRLRRIFAERGHDFFDRNESQLTDIAAPEKEEDKEEESAQDKSVGPMTVDELNKMRFELLNHLFTAYGEMTLARDLLDTLLNTSSSSIAATSTAAILAGLGVAPTAAPPSSPKLSSTTVSKPASIVSVQAFDAQLTIGGKDEALRSASAVFKTAAGSMERARIRGERYWVNALKVRRANWGLSPAPLPFGAPTGKGADKTSKDFLISYGLEEASAMFRRRAVARMPIYEQPSEPMIFPHRQKTRMSISVSNVDPPSKKLLSINTMSTMDDGSVDFALRAAQREVVEHEIFSNLVKEAGSLPTSTARVSERLIVIEAAKGLELRFDLLDDDAIPLHPPNVSSAKCDLIYHMLQALLLRRHAYLKHVRLSGAGVFRRSDAPEARPPPLILRPIIDLLQYEVFCERVRSEMVAASSGLRTAGIEAILRFVTVGGTGQGLMAFLSDAEQNAVGGQALLRIDKRHTVRLTFRSPQSLTAHLSQATLSISSIPQLRQMLADEIEGCLLRRFCELGQELCESVGGTWFTDQSLALGRWDGCVLNFRVFITDCSIRCSASSLTKAGPKEGDAMNYSADLGIPLLTWVAHTIRDALDVS
ncbi:Mediator of RNA polymerase II transcription subunit 17 [Mycena indigotica]|uniref:Mediator of RNA polymerase II transcription subunit 17 n=1 Tax=Mycena indigotica TaxID=2126181 RepID=A0A8H6SLQ0_9AGAR|nr:Mediator of RNA polymerase II transcription subunit 17 [Mycena indigotica]KAF7301716.1 Mediator of RNA polymerase II transcription subunit 17 [Mycena indigotica]